LERLSAPHQIGKSFMAISMAASVATGTMFAQKAVQQGKVFYLAGEGLNGITRRFSGFFPPNRYLPTAQ
jgi:RecA-family ATPase